MSKIIGIVGNLFTMEEGISKGIERAYVNDDYVRAIEKVNANPIILPAVYDLESIKKQIEICDGIIISGGQDIHPKFYNQELHTNIARVYTRIDEYQLKLAKLAIESNKPLLGICRGHQVINVALGGDLYQDLRECEEEKLKHIQDCNRYEVAHKIYIEENSILGSIYNSEIWVNSYHHQIINKLGNNLKVVARASDNSIEAVEMKNKKFVMGVQWHPEMMLAGSDFMKVLFEKFVSSCD
ncbi:MAG: gamma-glutamyl-gamma-aminobutyrate hydrolase family protein [Peptostreptococcaceae bacterium]